MEQIRLHDLWVALDPENDADVIQRGIRQGWYEGTEVALARKMLTSTDRVIELGTGMGIVTTAIAKIVGSDAVLGFEANGSIIGRAQTNFALNEVSPEIRQMACRPQSAGTEPVSFVITPVFWASHLGSGGTGQTVSVPVVSLENVIREFRATALVMDIEGGEIEILSYADLTGLNTIIFETHKSAGLHATNRAIWAAFGQGFLIDFHASRDEIVVLSRAS